MSSNLKSISKFISLILRHHPEAVGIAIDEHGWADVRELIKGINRTSRYHIDIDTLETIVRMDEKQRYSFNEDHALIRANQGHSIPVNVELEKKQPPEVLYHGTGEKSVESIDMEGLKPMSRLYVHLSKDEQAAKKVGSRHGRPVVYQVAAGRMQRDGAEFFLSANGVWLVKAVPAKYLKKKGVSKPPSAPPELADRQIYTTPIGSVCMSKAEYEAYREEVELKRLKKEEAETLSNKSIIEK